MAVVTLERLKIELVAPLMFVHELPLLVDTRHWNEAAPVARTEKEALCPAVTV